MWPGNAVRKEIARLNKDGWTQTEQPHKKYSAVGLTCLCEAFHWPIKAKSFRALVSGGASQAG